MKNQEEIVKKEIIQNIRRWFENFEGPYTVKEYQKYEMKYSIGSIYTVFDSWKEVIKQAGLKESVDDYKKKTILKSLYSWYENFEGPYLIKHYLSKKQKPSIYTIYKYFGSFENAMKQMEIKYNVKIKQKDTNKKNKKNFENRKKEIIISLKKWFETTEGIHTRAEYLKQKMKPSIYIIEYYFGSWSSALEEANINYSSANFLFEKKYTDQELINILKEWATNSAGPYTMSEYRKLGIKPYTYTFYYRFGSWENALKEAGIDKCAETIERFTNEEIILILNQWSKIYKGPYTTRAFQQYREQPSLGKIYSKFGSWEEALSKAGLTFTERSYSEEEMINSLKEWKKGYQGPYTVTKYREAGLLPAVQTYISHFGKWSIALKKAGIRDLKPLTYTKITNEETIEVLKNWIQETNAPLTGNEYIKQNIKPSYSTIVIKFGSWANAMNLAKNELSELIYQ